jgi:hypothetical protein
MSRGRQRQCTVAITIDEVEDGTRALARMTWRDRTLVGVGSTRPSELFPDRVSERLAVSRALSDLVARVQTCAGDDGADASHPSSLHWFARTNDGDVRDFLP